MFKKIVFVALSMVFAVSATAADLKQVDQSFALKDGSTVYIFKDGKMAMESSRGAVVAMKPGQVMEAKDGQKLIMVGNELFRLESSLGRYNYSNP